MSGETQTEIQVCAAVIRRGGRWLLAERKAGSHLERHWEFPGGKLHPGETLAECIIREIREELGVGIRCFGKVGEERHAGVRHHIHLHFLECEITEGEPQGCEGQAVGWFSRAQMGDLLMAPADRRFAGTLPAEEPGALP